MNDENRGVSVQFWSGEGRVSQFDVAVSFNGKDRNIVEEKVREMTRAGIRVFYDKDYEVETLGQDLSKLFRETYSQKSKSLIVLPFISKNYGESDWSDFESQIIRKRLQAELNDEFISVIQVRLDDTPVFGFSDKFGFVDLREGGEDRFLELLTKKLSSLGLKMSGVIDITPYKADENIKYDIKAIRQILLCDSGEEYNSLKISSFQKFLISPKSLEEHLCLLSETGYIKNVRPLDFKYDERFMIFIPPKFESERRDKFLKLFKHTSKWNKFKTSDLQGRTKFTKNQMCVILYHIAEKL